MRGRLTVPGERCPRRPRGLSSGITGLRRTGYSAAGRKRVACGVRRGVRCGSAACAVRSRKGALNVVVGRTAIVAAWLRCVGLALACARAHAVCLLHGTALLPRRSPELLLGALRVVVVGGASGRWRGAAGKAHALWPLVAVIVSVCHSNHLASCVTCLSYIKRCTTHGYVRQKPDKWYERCRAARQASRQQAFKSRQDESVQDE